MAKTPAKKAASATKLEPIKVQMVRIYDDAALNTDNGKIVDVVAFPENVPVAHVSINVGASAEYGASKVGVMVTVPTSLEEIDEAKEFAKAKAEEIFNELAAETGDGEAEDEGEETEDDEEVEEAPARRKRGKKAAAEDEAEEDEDEDEAEEDEDEDEVTEDDIRAMTRAQLETFIEENDLETDPSDYKKNKKGLTDMQNAVILEMSEAGDDEDETEEDEADEDEDEAEAEEDEDEAEEDDEEEAPYTMDELKAMKPAALVKIWKAWKMPGKPPVGKTDKGTSIMIAKKIFEFMNENGE